jgi:murein DD-endopeptidase MepM/ murein hydrolase activator NlpD
LNDKHRRWQATPLPRVGEGSEPHRDWLTRRQVMVGSVALATATTPLWWTGAATATSGAGGEGPMSDEAVTISRVVPGGRLGAYRHGTYPSRGNRTHIGVDIVAPCGTQIQAPEPGTVIDQIRSPSDPDFESLGYMVIVEHPASLTGRVFYTLYLHLQTPPVRAEHVDRGTELGRVGTTGRSTGCHLHFEVRYFRDRVSSLWQNIYGPGDQRASRHFRENWEEPLTFLARLEREHPSA